MRACWLFSRSDDLFLGKIQSPCPAQLTGTGKPPFKNSKSATEFSLQLIHVVPYFYFHVVLCSPKLYYNVHMLMTSISYHCTASTSTVQAPWGRHLWMATVDTRAPLCSTPRPVSVGMENIYWLAPAVALPISGRCVEGLCTTVLCSW